MWYWRQGKYTDQVKRIEFEERDISLTKTRGGVWSMGHKINWNLQPVH